MGEATDRKVTEIEQTRSRLEADLAELEARLPAPVRSMKSVVGLLIGSAAFSAFVLRKLRSGRSTAGAPTEVVIRVVRDDE
jgi:hypothetical protein